MKLFNFFIIGIYLLISSSVFAIGPEGESQDSTEKKQKTESISNANALQILEGHVKKGEFLITRGLKDYIRVFGPHFEHQIRTMTNDDHVLDAGAGQAQAWTAYLLTPNSLRDWGVNSFYELFPDLKDKYPSENRAKVTAVTYSATRDGWYDPNVTELLEFLDQNRYLGSCFHDPNRRLRYKGQLRILVHRYLDAISDEELFGSGGKFTMITDLFGVVAYSWNPTRDLHRYVDILRENGTIYLDIGSVTPFLSDGSPAASLYQPTVKTLSGRVVSYADWIRTIPGFEVTEHNYFYSEDPAPMRSFQIKIPNKAAVQIPHLKLVHAEPGRTSYFTKSFEEVAQ